jgi:glucosyl-dolichyl phosphate glucuronosyltransferase
MRPPTRLSASVVMCAFADRRFAVLAEAVRATLAQRPAPDELLLVIDHNAALERRCRVELPGPIRVLASEEAPGLSGARNTGVRHARGEVVVFLDDDAVPEPGWLGALLAPYADARVVGVGGHVAPRWARDRPAWLPEEFWWTVGCSYRGHPTGPAAIRNPIGANMSFRRSAFSVTEGFTEGIGRLGSTPLGCEETEFSIRVRRRVPGSVITYAPGARVAHLVPDERTTWRYFASRCWSEGLSKALVADQVGADDALSSERSYALRTLPAGMLRGARDLVRGDPWGLVRACAILAGLALTTAGYARGLLSSRGASPAARAASG